MTLLSLIQLTDVLFLDKGLLFTSLVLEEKITKASKQILHTYTPLKFCLGNWNEDLEHGIKLNFTGVP